jgi:hypothetical protein
MYSSSILRYIFLILGFLNESLVDHSIQYRKKRWWEKSNAKNIVGSGRGLIYERANLIELPKGTVQGYQNCHQEYSVRGSKF